MTDNEKDKVAHGTRARGAAMYNAKLTDDLVRTIRSDTRTHKEIARENGIDRTLVGKIKDRKTWRHVT